MTRFRIALGLTLAAGLAAHAWAAPLPGQLSAADVRTKIVGHSVTNDDDTMTWRYQPTGTFSGDNGRNAQTGRFTVRDDGQLCWKDTAGIAGCFVYVQKGKQLVLHRVDPGHEFELGVVTIGKGD